MQMLILLMLAGAASGSVGGLVLEGADGLWLGTMSGVVFGAATWLLAGVVLRMLRERRLNRYFNQDHDTME